VNIEQMRRRVGWFVLLGMVLIGLILLSLFMHTDLFKKHINIYFSPPSAAQFFEGQPVKFQGFPIGRIEQIALNGDGGVVITLRILQRYQPMLHQGGVVRLVSESFIGEQSLELTAGDKQRPMLAAGAKIPYESAATVEQLLRDIKPAVKHANVLLKELASLATWINDPKGGFRQMIAQFNDVSHDLDQADLQQMSRNVSGIIANVNRITGELSKQHIATTLNQTLQASNQLLHDLQPIGAELKQHGAKGVQQLQALIGQLNQLSQSLTALSSDLTETTPELPALVRETQSTIAEMHRLLTQLRNSWLLGGSAPATGGQPSTGHKAMIPPPALGLQPQ